MQGAQVQLVECKVTEAISLESPHLRALKRLCEADNSSTLHSSTVPTTSGKPGPPFCTHLQNQIQNLNKASLRCQDFSAKPTTQTLGSKQFKSHQQEMIHQGQAHEDSTASQGVRKMAEDLAVLQD